MKEKDNKILSCLREDARMPLTRMSRKIAVPISTIFDRLKVIEEGIVQKYTSLLNFAKLGYNCRTTIILKIERECKEAMKEYLMRQNQINSIYKINSGYDFMIEGVFKQMQDLEAFLETLQEKFKVLEIKTYYVLEDLKREGFLIDPLAGEIKI